MIYRIAWDALSDRCPGPDPVHLVNHVPVRLARLILIAPQVSIEVRDTPKARAPNALAHSTLNRRHHIAPHLLLCLRR